MKRYLRLIVLLVSSAAFASVSGEWRVNLLKGSTTAATVTGKTEDEAWSACQARIVAPASGSQQYTCQTPRFVATATADAPPPVCTTPKPADETQPGVCPAGTVGTWSQSRAYVSAAYPTCWVAGPWTPASAPSGICATPPSDPPSTDPVPPVTGKLILDDNFANRPVGKVSISGAWASAGFTEITADSLIEVTDRSKAPAGLLADPRVPATKNRFLHIQHSANELQNRIMFGALPVGTREVFVSWDEYRPNANRGGEKWLRFGNRIDNGNRGLDAIIVYGINGDGSGKATLGYIPNSTQMYQAGQELSWGPLKGINNSLNHYEVHLKLSSGTNSDGVVEVWEDGVSVGSSSHVRFNRDATDAARNLTIIEFGGWSSTGGISAGAKYPLDRWFTGFRIATTHQPAGPIQ